MALVLLSSQLGQLRMYPANKSISEYRADLLARDFTALSPESPADTTKASCCLWRQLRMWGTALAITEGRTFHIKSSPSQRQAEPVDLSRLGTVAT